ncbi:PRSS8 protein, partial [Bucco capensis]|nr:PRSS8 protein [Bucco capensis]
LSRVTQLLLPPSGQEDGGDLALARLEPAVTFSRLVRPICLPGPGTRLPTGTKCTVTGWGHVRSDSEWPLGGASGPGDQGVGGQ